MTYSLQARALLIGSLVLAAFLGATGWVLDRAFRDSAEAALRDGLQGYAETLQAAIEKDHLEGLKSLPQTLGDRLRQPGSGLYAVLTRQSDDQLVWRSESAKDLPIPWPPLPDFWSGRLDPLRLPNGTPLYVLSVNLIYKKPRHRPIPYLLQIAETLDDKQSYYYSRVNRIRRDLWGWFAGAAAFLLLLQMLILRRSFAPLRRVAADLRDIEAGRAERLTGHYPRELHGLTENLNALLDQAEAHLARYRHALGDLAHSLKTPLAVLRGAAEGLPPEADDARAVLRDQIERMNRIIEYQLKRAAASGRSHLAQPVGVADKARQLVAALSKVYADKAIACRIEIAPELAFHGDEGDLLEILGNLADNAFKWARRQVLLSARRDGDARLELRVEDDGPGIPGAVADRLRQRGERADSSVPGHGLGLAIVDSIVQAYDGQLLIGTSPLGGAAVTVRGLG
ncbi:ATP-binding protein [Candidatus Methylocalor cossyra]|uniref:histidine kinase n=1 Tax=Candidatus Methylocalor cossyra TaxID=3108543 RepID=A0ABP1C5Y1_9GAMM